MKEMTEVLSLNPNAVIPIPLIVFEMGHIAHVSYCTDDRYFLSYRLPSFFDTVAKTSFHSVKKFSLCVLWISTDYLPRTLSNQTPLPFCYTR